jgi:hypothetical protein
MVPCGNAFCLVEIGESNYIVVESRKFCCIGCAEDWRRQNDALNEAAAPFHTQVLARNRRSGSARTAGFDSRRD